MKKIVSLLLSFMIVVNLLLTDSISAFAQTSNSNISMIYEDSSSYVDENEYYNIEEQSEISLYNSVWDGSSKTEVVPVNDVYRIDSSDELAWFAQAVNAGDSFLGKHIFITGEIDLGNNIWEPIGNGKILECSIEIKDCHISGINTNVLYSGLFGNISVKQFVIDNLCIDNSTLTRNNSSWSATSLGLLLGALTVPLDGYLKVSNSMFQGTLNNKHNFDDGFTGGIIGKLTFEAENGQVIFENNSVDVTVYGSNVTGGLIGFVVDENLVGDLEIKRCNVNCDVKASNTYGYNDTVAGGLIGILNGDNVSINQCTVTGSVYSSGYEGWCGGLVGHAIYNNLQISDCVVSANINSFFTGWYGTKYNGGGFLGFSHCYNNTNSLIRNSYFNGTINSGVAFVAHDNNAGDSSIPINNCYFDLNKTGLSSDMMHSYGQRSQTPGLMTNVLKGCIGYTSEQMQIEKNFINWDFQNIWMLDKNVNSGYPYIREWENDFQTEISKEDKYTLQHLNFVNSVIFETASNDFRYATTLWTNSYDNTSQVAGEFLYDVLEGMYERITFQDISSLENPYDAILLDLLSSKSINASLTEAVDSSAISIIDNVIGDLITTFQADSEWEENIDIEENFKDLLDLKASDYSSNKLYKELDKLFDGKSTDQINSIFEKYECYSNVLAYINDMSKGVDYFLEIFKYIVSIEAYYNASQEFKEILKEVADTMPTVNEVYGEKFNETYIKYSSCIDYNSVMQSVLDYALEEGFWLVSDLMSDVLQDSVITFCTTALKMSKDAAVTLSASLWAFETGFELSNMITANDTTINCRRLLRANYMLDEAVHYVMCSHASKLQADPNYDEALYFDVSFNLFKNLQISSLELHQKHMNARGSSFIYFISGKQDIFKREAEAQAVIINTWKKIKCHNAIIDSSNCTKTNTVVVDGSTNVYVYRKSDGELVASTVNNVIYNVGDALTVVTESNENAVCLPNFDDYEIKIEATDSGSMTVEYTVGSLERPHYERAVSFNNLEVNEQSTFDFQVDSDSDSISLVDENQDIVLPDLDTSDLVFKSASLTLQDDLVINYKVNETLFTESGYTNPYVVFSLNGVETKVTEYTIENGRYVFDFEDIVPHQMNDTIYATLYATYDGVEYASQVREYSVATYCYNMLDKYDTNEYAKLQTLLVDLLNYGAASQEYMDYKADALVNEKLTEAQKAMGTSTERTLETLQDLEYKTIENPTVQWKGGGLNLQKSVGMRFKISADNIENLTVKVTNDIGEETIITSDTFEATDGGYYVFFDGLNAGQMSDEVYLTVYDGETAVSNTIRYSIESYAYAKQNSSDTNLAELVKAMMKYGDSAREYIN